MVSNNSICNMLDLINPFRSYCRISFGFRNNFPNTILHNRFLFLYHCIFQYFFLAVSSQVEGSESSMLLMCATYPEYILGLFHYVDEHNGAPSLSTSCIISWNHANICFERGSLSDLSTSSIGSSGAGKFEDSSGFFLSPFE